MIYGLYVSHLLHVLAAWIPKFETRYNASQNHVGFWNRSLVDINMSKIFKNVTLIKTNLHTVYIVFTLCLHSVYILLTFQFTFRVELHRPMTSRSSKLRVESPEPNSYRVRRRSKVQPQLFSAQHLRVQNLLLADNLFVTLSRISRTFWLKIWV